MASVTTAVEDDRVQGVLAADRQNALRLLMIVRIAISVAGMGFLIITFPGAFGLYLAGLVLLFGLFGLVQYLLRRSRYGADWQAYVFVALDLALIAFILLHTNPFSADPFPPAQRLRYPNFDYLYVIVGLLAIGATPRLVAWSGIAAVLVWGAAVAWIVSLPGTMTEYDVPGLMALPMAERLQIANGPDFVWLLPITQELFAMLLFGGTLAAVAWRARLLLGRQLQAERARANLSRYFSPGMVDQLAQQDDLVEDVREQDVAVIFADIVAFTRIAESQSPEEIIGMLREFHGRMARAVFAHGGTVDKYIGDSIMATFGTPRVGSRDASNALACAHEMLSAMREWNVERTNAGEALIEIGIGLHYGPAVMGNIGEERRLEYAVVGDTVNIAARLESLTREYKAPMLISDAAVAAARSEGDADMKLLAGLSEAGDANLRGRIGRVGVWTMSDTSS